MVVKVGHALIADATVFGTVPNNNLYVHALQPTVQTEPYLAEVALVVLDDMLSLRSVQSGVAVP